MQVRSVLFALVVFAVVVTLALTGVAAAQAPTRGATQASARGVQASAPAARLHGNLIQVMRGVIYPASNVVFFAQAGDPAAVKQAADPSIATDPLESAYGGWLAVENAGLALAESANLLTIPGRVCSNGRPAPLQRADWAKFVQGLRAAGMSAYKAAQSKNQDNVVEAAGEVSEACANCHDVYREKPKLADRCLP